ncbi:hypothetical protein [Agromyces badenianii]|uniref:hypothetical protein n=1 Tax=Agromyces badenianii TaxID=2080742 RepID=UPI000D592940|nr:hypothetical protein [Agromyces badenianii]PWC05408.1 hypothetical protein DCE94_03810 [Agromyces badenianii]
MGVRINVQMTSNIGAVAADMLDRIALGETKAAHRLLALSLPRTPLDNGPLREAGAVEPAETAESGAQVVFDTPYAARLHEHPEYHFQEAGTGGKWLEETAVENRKELGDIIRKEATGA